MALKDVLEDKKKKRTITIVGTIVIILVTAGVFSYEASSIEVKEPQKEETIETGETDEEETPAEGETGSYHYENDGTITGSSPCRILITGETEAFPVEAGAKRFIVTVSSDKDIDLYIEDPDDTIVESSATAETTETIEINNPSPAGEWNAWITLWSTVHRPFNSANYHIVIDVYYE